MVAPDSPNPSAGPGVPPQGKGWLAGWTSQHTAWLLFGPPAVMAAVRWLLQSISERQSATPAPPLAPVSTTASSLELLWPVALVLAGLAVAGWVLYRIGRRRSLPVLGAAWLLVWLGGSAAMVQRHLNREGLFLQPGVSAAAVAGAGAVPVRASVVTSQFKKPNLHSLGGTELVLQVAGLQVPQRLLLDDAQAALLKPGDALALQLAPGRFSGSFVTGWQPQPPAAPVSPAASEPAPAVVGPAMPAVPALAASH